MKEEEYVKTIRNLGSAIIVLVISFSVFLQKGEADTETEQIKLRTLPASSFLDAKNMAPGDEVSSTLNLATDGSQGMNVGMNTRLESGSTLFYEALQLTVSSEGQILYKGPLSKFQNNKLSGVNENGKNLLFTISFPLESGNELQNQTAIVAFDFNGEVPVVNQTNNGLPNTATNAANYLMIGFILLSAGWLALRSQRTDNKITQG